MAGPHVEEGGWVLSADLGSPGGFSLENTHVARFSPVFEARGAERSDDIAHLLCSLKYLHMVVGGCDY